MGLLRTSRLLGVVCTFAVVALVHGQARSAEEAEYVWANSSPTSQAASPSHASPLVAPLVRTSAYKDITVDAIPDAVEAIPNANTNAVPNDLMTSAQVPNRVWTIDYRFKSFCNSQTSYEIGTIQSPSEGGYSPLSVLRFPLNSSWHGLQVGIEKPDWAIHAEWLTPISQQIHGTLADYDWDPPNSDGSFTDLGYAKQRWNDGQTLTLDLESKLSDNFLGLPMEVWPMVGFRWQRFCLTAYDLAQVKYHNRWDPIYETGDSIDFNQQYYICYIGGQLRKTFYITEEKRINLTFQGDWGATWGYHIDHHLNADGGFYGMQQTQGSSWHIALTAEVPMSQRLSLGVQADYMEIRTTGKTWEVGRNPDVWTNGVGSSSDQTSITAFARLNF